MNIYGSHTHKVTLKEFHGLLRIFFITSFKRKNIFLKLLILSLTSTVFVETLIWMDVLSNLDVFSYFYHFPYF